MDCRSDIVGGKAPSLCVSAISSTHSSNNRRSNRRAAHSRPNTYSSFSSSAAATYSWLPWAAPTITDTPSTPQGQHHQQQHGPKSPNVISTHGMSVAARAARFGAVVQFKPMSSSSSNSYHPRALLTAPSSDRPDETAIATTSRTSSSSSVDQHGPSRPLLHHPNVMSSAPGKSRSQRHRTQATSSSSASSVASSGDSMTSGPSTHRSGFSGGNDGGSVVSITSHHRMPISMTALPKHRQGLGHSSSSSAGQSHLGQGQVPCHHHHPLRH